MKRLIAAVSLALLAVSAFAASEEYDERSRAFFKTPPQLAVDRSSPHTEERGTLSAASSGETRSDRESAIDKSFKSIWATGPWANDHHFIAPAP